MSQQLAKLGCLILLITLSLVSRTPAAQPDSFESLARAFAGETRPLMQRFCLGCHSTDEMEGDLDLERFGTLDDVRRARSVWQKVAEMLDNGEMPPKKAKQPSAQERVQLRGWVGRYLQAEAYASAGDPGPVVLRRLNNAQYTYTVCDLTGLELTPAKEFPADSAAGEGFTNTGNALVMSPALLTKYLDAGKEIARHAVLLPDGIRFSPGTTRRDWTDEVLGRIRQIYAQHTDPQAGTKVNLQGLTWESKDGGRLPLDKYLAATLAERDALAAGRRSIEEVARQHGLNAKYLAALWNLLRGDNRSPLVDTVRARWRGAGPSDAGAIAADIAEWQKALARFQSVGHMKQWMVPMNPITGRQEIRFKIPEPATGDEVKIYLSAGDAGDGNANDFVVWQQPQLVIPGRSNLALRDVRDFTRSMIAWRQKLFASAASCLAAAAEAGAAGEPDRAELARRRGVDPEVLIAWLDYLGIGTSAAIRLDHFKNRLNSAGNYDFIKGWGSPDTPSLVANSSDQHVRIPGNMKPHGVAVHPSPTLYAAVGWQSPVEGVFSVEAKVTHAHPECGNGVTWSLELRRGATRQRLAAGTAAGPKEVKVGPVDKLSIRAGDLVSLLIGPRDGNHACDLTDIELVLITGGETARQWSLTRDVSSDLLAANPHADRFGNDGVWHFYTEPVQGQEAGPVLPAGSLLARWQSAEGDDAKQKLAHDVQKLLTSGPPTEKDHPDSVLYRQLAALSGPLLAGVRQKAAAAPQKEANDSESADKATAATAPSNWGLDPAMFGRHPNASAIDPASLCVQAPSVIEVRLPADLMAGCELVTTAVLHRETATEGSAQIQVAGAKLDATSRLHSELPVLAAEGSATWKRFETAFDEFRSWFPAALCYTRIVPVDEVVTLTLFHREDEPLCRLVLDESQKAELDRLWDELHFVSHDALTLVDAYAQLMEYATQDSNPKLFEPFRKPIHDRAAAFRKLLVDTEPRHVEVVVQFAARAYRRPQSQAEADQLRDLYRRLREQEIPHDDAIRLTLARVFVAPAFLYRLEDSSLHASRAEPAPTPRPTRSSIPSHPVTDWELASRLSYFLWSSMPEDELFELARSGRLHDPQVLADQSRRMLGDPRARRLASEFACQWLHIYDFDTLDEKSERHFPTFTALRSDMYEEAIRYFTDLFQRDASVLSIFDADHAILNQAMAEHYGIPNVSGPEWRRVDGVRPYGRGGILGLAATLAKQSGASRTSPILRGNWVAEVLLGDKLPRPPKDVPRLPEDETATDGLTVRQLVEKHSNDQRCAGCHVRIDPLGFALEGFDAIGRRRDKDLGDRPIETRARAMDGAEFEGIDGLRNYLLTARRAAVLRQFYRKLLGYALGRGVQLSDEPLLDEMAQQLESHDYRFSAAIETIVRSRQFREIRAQGAELDTE